MALSFVSWRALALGTAIFLSGVAIAAGFAIEADLSSKLDRWNFVTVALSALSALQAISYHWVLVGFVSSSIAFFLALLRIEDRSPQGTLRLAPALAFVLSSASTMAFSVLMLLNLPRCAQMLF